MCCVVCDYMFQGKMLILDLFSEVVPIYPRTESYYGQPFIWCMLHDFGGTMELYGTLDSINTVRGTAELLRG
jgi:alpha-N-acetylglucosaminidase